VTIPTGGALAISPCISASILGCDLGRVVEEARSAEAAGAAVIHADVMDGLFVPNISFGPDLIARVVAGCALPVTAHLMVEKPERLIDLFLATGARRILVHPEATPHIRRAIDLIREGGASPGVTLNPGTDLSVLEPLLPFIDEVLIMTVNPGWGGQRMMPDQLAKVRALRARVVAGEIAPLDLSVDGGISPETAREAINAGANVLVAGTALFGAADRAGAVREMLAEA
jgi:ribulose-phosphate 3-epimerase